MEQENVTKPLRCDHGQLRWRRTVTRTCGTYLPHNIKEKFGNACNFGLYKDDGLGVTKAAAATAAAANNNNNNNNNNNIFWDFIYMYFFIFFTTNNFTQL